MKFEHKKLEWNSNNANDIEGSRVKSYCSPSTVDKTKKIITWTQHYTDGLSVEWTAEL